MPPTLSIIIPIYNGATYIDKCIGSLLQQPYTDFELFLINDGSTDNSGEICNRYAAQDSRIRVIHKTNEGLSMARNTALEICQGDYITFIDVDDFIEADTLSSNMAVLLSNPQIDLLEYPVLISDKTDNAQIIKHEPKLIEGVENIFNYWILQKGYLHAFFCNKIFKKNLFEKLRFPPHKYYEDLYLLPTILKKTNTFYQSQQGLYHYCYHSESITQKPTFANLIHRYEAQKNLLETMQISGISQQSLQQYILFVTNSIIDICRLKDRDTDQITTIIKNISFYTPGIKQLFKLPIPFKDKVKNIPLALWGLKIHCQIYSHLRINQHTL